MRSPARIRDPHRPTVTYWNNEPSPYFVRRMNALHERGVIGIEAWFSEFRSSDRDWSVDPGRWLFPSRFLPGGPRRAVSAINSLRREQPDVFVTLYGTSSAASTAFMAKVVRTPVVIHAMRTFSSWRRRSAIREAAKHTLFRLADGVQVCGPDSVAYAEGYGAPPTRIFAIREEVDLSFWTPVAEARQAGRREPLPSGGLAGCVFLYVGRLWRGKGIDSLLDAYASLRQDSVECSLVLVGTGEEERRLRARTEEMDGVVFAGFVEDDDLRDWYSAADVLVFPTLGDPYGHVVQEAMACGLPVIATTAAGDIADRVIEGETGYLVPPGDARSLANRMRQLAADPLLRSRLGAKGSERVQDWSTELWATRFEEMIFAVLESRSGR